MDKEIGIILGESVGVKTQSNTFDNTIILKRGKSKENILKPNNWRDRSIRGEAQSNILKFYLGYRYKFLMYNSLSLSISIPISQFFPRCFLQEVNSQNWFFPPQDHVVSTPQSFSMTESNDIIQFLWHKLQVFMSTHYQDSQFSVMTKKLFWPLNLFYNAHVQSQDSFDGEKLMSHFSKSHLELYHNIYYKVNT